MIKNLKIMAIFPAAILLGQPALAEVNVPAADTIEVTTELASVPAVLLEKKTSELQAATAPTSGMLSADELTQMRGGHQLAINNQLLNSENTGHVIEGDFTAGDVSIADDAFSNFNGLGNFVFNTGAQSSLQAGMSVTINVSE